MANERDLRLHLASANDDEFREQAAQFCEMLTRINMLELAKYKDELPCCLGCGGVRYVPPPGCAVPRPCQEVYDALMIYKNKAGTCMDLAPERCARLRLQAIDEGRASWDNFAQEVAWCAIDDQLDGDGQVLPGYYHALVELADGSEQDPSVELQEQPGQCAGAACNCGGHG